MHTVNQSCLVKFGKRDLEQMQRRAAVAHTIQLADKLFMGIKYLCYLDTVITSEFEDDLEGNALDDWLSEGIAVIEDMPEGDWTAFEGDNFTPGGWSIYIDKDDARLEVWEKYSGVEYFSTYFTLETVKECLK